MTIQVPFHLRHRSITEPAVALPVPSRAPARAPGILLAWASIPPGRTLTSRAASFWKLERPAVGPMPGASASGRSPRGSTCRSMPS